MVFKSRLLNFSIFPDVNIVGGVKSHSALAGRVNKQLHTLAGTEPKNNHHSHRRHHCPVIDIIDSSIATVFTIFTFWCQGSSKLSGIVMILWLGLTRIGCAYISSELAASDNGLSTDAWPS